MGIIKGVRTIRNPLSMGGVQVAAAEYDFDTDAGAQGDITLRGDSIPSGAVVVDALLYVDTVPTSGGAATVAVKIEGAADINDADAISGAPWSTTGPKRADFTATSAPIETTAERDIVATVGTADLTAGKFRAVVWYVEID